MNTDTVSGECLAHLARALPVDVEHDVVSSRQHRTHRVTGSPVVPIEDPGMLEKRPGPHHRLELAPADEVVVDPVDLARSVRRGWCATR